MFMQYIALDCGWIDFESPYGLFLRDMIFHLEKIDREKRYIIFSTTLLEFTNTNFESHVIKKSRWIRDDKIFCKKLKKLKLSFVLFCDQERKISYTKRYSILLESLKEISYPSFVNTNFLQKQLQKYILHKWIDTAERIICFDWKTKEEINENFDKKESEIHIIPWFFPLYDKEILQDTSEIKFWENVDAQFLIYDAWPGNNKNLEKLVKAMSLVNKNNNDIKLYVIWDELIRDISFREYIIEHDAVDSVKFLWALSLTRKKHYYEKALWVILPSLYESFPFSLISAVNFKVPVISGNLQAIKDVFWEHIRYFHSLSINQMREQIELLSNKKSVDYTDIQKKYSVEKTVEELQGII